MVTDLLGDRRDFLLIAVHVGLARHLALVHALCVLVAAEVATGRGEARRAADVMMDMVKVVGVAVVIAVPVWRLWGSRYGR